MTNPTGDAKASAAQVRVKPLVWTQHPHALMWRCDTIVGCYQVAAIVEPASWTFDGLPGVSASGFADDEAGAKAASQADYEARIHTALSPVEQAPQPVAVVTQPIGFMDVDGLGALVDEVRSRPAAYEAPPVESQAAEIRAKALEEAAKIADAAGIEWAADAELWLKDGHPNTAAVSKQHSRAAENVAAAIRAALTAEGSADA